MRSATLLASLALAATFVALDPAETLAPGAFLPAARAVAVAALGILCASGAGGALVLRFRPDLLAGPTGFAWALASGIGTHSAAMTLLTFAGVVSPVTSAIVLALLGSGWLVRPRFSLPAVPAAGVLLACALLVPSVIEALAPPTDTDELYYQLAIPRHIATSGGLEGGLLHPDHSRPLPVQALAAGLYALGGAGGPRFWHLGVTIALVLTVRTIGESRFGAGRGDIGALALLGSWSFLREAGLAYNNVPVALWLLLASEALLGGALVPMAWMAGLAVAGKFTAGPAAAAIFLVAAWDKRRIAVVPALVALLPTLPWLARNALRGDHPFFPFAGWPDAPDFSFVFPEKYGAGHSWIDAAWLPLRVLFSAETDSMVFFGRISLVWAAIAAGTVSALRDGAVRRIALIVLIGFVAWASSAQILRYLVPLAGIGAILGGTVRYRGAALLLFAASLPANLAPALERAARRVEVATGKEDADTFLTRELPAWPAVRFLRDTVPVGETVALLNAWPRYWIDHPTVLGSVEDHVPTRHWVVTHGDAAIRELETRGVRWLLVGDVKYLRKTWKFLDTSSWQAQLRDPQERLEALLMRDATRVFAANHHAVWHLDTARLDAPPPIP